MPSNRNWGIVLALSASLVAIAGAGCSSGSSNTASSTGSKTGDQSEGQVIENGSEATDAVRTPIDDLEAALPLIREAFFNNVEVDKQIYPPGWHKRRTRPTDIQWSITEGDAQTAGSKALVQVTYEPRYSIIHETKKQAEADDDLVPYAPQATRKEMTENPLNSRLEPIQISIHYERRADGWVRNSWSAAPDNVERPDWLDELGVP